MANHTVVLPNKMSSKDLDAKVRPVTSGSDLDNGNIFRLDSKSATAGESDVWVATAPTTGSLNGLWMALEPEVPFLLNGTRQYNKLGTVQDFYNPAGQVFTAVKLMVDDIITFTVENLDDATVQAYAIATNGSFEWTWADSTVANTAVLRYLETTYIPSADGSIGTGRIVGYTFEVLAN